MFAMNSLKWLYSGPCHRFLYAFITAKLYVIDSFYIKLMKSRCSVSVKGYMHFLYYKKHNVHRFTLNLHSLKIMISRKLP